ncbi:MAG TPA: hypothetical protein VFU41_15835 [Gemmatimonadales bacterium]|nr:hypothetical protein [Gemmatimonadales bacterium]
MAPRSPGPASRASALAAEAVFQNEIVEPSTAFLGKPFTSRQLITRVREVLDAPLGDAAAEA